MSDTAILEKFLTVEAEPIVQESLRAVSEYYEANKNELVSDFQKSFAELCDSLEQMENCQPVAYIQIHLLRTSILAKENMYLLEARDKNLYTGRMENITHTFYDASWLFDFYHQATAKMQTKSKKYRNKINLMDQELLYKKLIEQYHTYTITLAKNSLNKSFVIESVQDIPKEPQMEITIGDYLDAYKTILVLE